jgi:DNA polymerase III sliding clamp (beta) subunit (PCNA family)
MKQITLHAKEYNDIMKAMKPVVSKDQYRPCLTGVYLEVEGGTARFTALNGYAMTHVVLPLVGEAEEPWNVIMPVTPIKAQLKALIMITVDGDQVTVKNVYTGEAVTQPVINDEYPLYRRVIPEPVKEHSIFMDARVLRGALEAASLCDQSLIRLSFNPESQIGPILLKGCGSDGTLYYTGIALPVKPGDGHFEHRI